jgi:hypothetical protein
MIGQGQATSPQPASDTEHDPDVGGVAAHVGRDNLRRGHRRSWAALGAEGMVVNRQKVAATAVRHPVAA